MDFDVAQRVRWGRCSGRDKREGESWIASGGKALRRKGPQTDTNAVLAGVRHETIEDLSPYDYVATAAAIYLAPWPSWPSASLRRPFLTVSVLSWTSGGPYRCLRPTPRLFGCPRQVLSYRQTLKVNLTMSSFAIR